MKIHIPRTSKTQKKTSSKPTPRSNQNSPTQQHKSSLNQKPQTLTRMTSETISKHLPSSTRTKILSKKSSNRQMVETLKRWGGPWPKKNYRLIN